ELLRRPRQDARAPARSARRHRDALRDELLLPEPSVLVLDLGELAVDLRDALVGLRVRHRAVLRRAVDLVLTVREEPANVIRGGHAGFVARQQTADREIRCRAPWRIRLVPCVRWRTC